MSKPKVLLWLDDSRNPFEGYWLSYSPIEQPFETIWVKSHGQFIDYITNNGLPDAICFDHDLGDVAALKSSLPFESWYSLEEKRELTGMDCAKWLVEYCLDNNLALPLYAIQSANPSGKENIDGLLKSFNKSVK